jgi:hypothetical protein
MAENEPFEKRLRDDMEKFDQKLKEQLKRPYPGRPTTPAKPIIKGVDPVKMAKDWDDHTSKDGRPPIGGALDD